MVASLSVRMNGVALDFSSEFAFRKIADQFKEVDLINAFAS